MATRKGQWTKGFFSGALAALVLVDACGQESLYAEIVGSIGAKELWEAAEDFDREHLERQGFKPVPDDGALRVECCRCKNKHKESERVEVPSKDLGIGAVDLVCPRCNGRSFYKLNAEGKRC